MLNPDYVHGACDAQMVLCPEVQVAALLYGQCCRNVLNPGWFAVPLDYSTVQRLAWEGGEALLFNLLCNHANSAQMWVTIFLLKCHDGEGKSGKAGFTSNMIHKTFSFSPAHFPLISTHITHPLNNNVY